MLLYHSVADRPGSGLEISPGMLRRQIVSLLSRGLAPATVSKALQRRDGHFAVTFDDASSSIRERALPLLRDLGVPATAFVPPPSDGSAGMLTLEDLTALVDNGWEIGSHCVTHRSLTELDDALLERELVESRTSVENELPTRCSAVAYPFGRADARVVAAARKAGYSVGCTVFGEASLSPGPLCWPRVGIDGREPMVAFHLRVSTAMRALRVALRR